MAKIFFLSIRFLFSRKINLLLILLIAICLGCLITVSTVAHGFSVITAEQTKSILSDLTIELPNQVLGISDQQALSDTCTKVEGVAAVSPYIIGKALYTDEYGSDSVCTIIGVDWEKEKLVSQLKDKLLNNLKAPECFERIHQRGAVVGSAMSNLSPESLITVFAKEGSIALEVRGAFKTGYGEWDFSGILVSLETAQILFGARDFEPNKYRKMSTGVRIKIKDGYDVTSVQNALQIVFRDFFYEQPGYHLMVQNYREINSIDIMAMESYEKIIHIILTIMLIMITFSIFIPVHSMVHEKEKDIGILKALGASRWFIFSVFVSIGLMLGLASTIIGLPLGFLISSHLNEILKFLDYNPFPPDVFYVDTLPIVYHKEGIILIVFFINFVAIFASILPAFRASLLKPIDLIRRV
jgi:lipoprotein-releasing system permease protein